MRIRHAAALVLALTSASLAFLQAQGVPAPAAPIMSPGPAAARYPGTSDEFDAYFKKVSNWGRWGPDDELGTAEPHHRRQAEAGGGARKTGRAVGLAHSPLTEREADNASPFEHTMNRGFTTDTYRVSYHGYAHSHIDALCHILYKDQTYNGYARADVNTDKGCTKLGIQNFRNGYVTRGILMDIPRLKGLPYLEPGTPIFVEDLEAWEKRAGMKVAPGRRAAPPHRPLGAPRQAGPVERGPERRRAARVGGAWLKARGVALIGSDAALDVVPSLVTGHQPAGAHAGHHRARPQHPRQPGSRSRSASWRRAQNRWEFMLTVAPVPVTGGTGFPVNAIATF